MAGISIWNDGKFFERRTILFWKEILIDFGFQDGVEIASGGTLAVSNAVNKYGQNLNTAYVGLGQYNSTISVDTEIHGAPIKGNINGYNSLAFHIGIDGTNNAFLDGEYVQSVTLTIEANNYIPSGKVPYGWLIVPQKAGSNSNFPYGHPKSFSGGEIVPGASITLVGDKIAGTNFTEPSYLAFPLVSNPRVVFDPCGGYLPTEERTRFIPSGEAIGELPIPNRTGYTFAGWWTAKEGGTEVTASTVVPTGNYTVFAHWSKKTCYVILDAAGGIVSPSIIEREVNKPYDSIPTPVRGGHTFAGWFTEDNQEVSADTIVPSGDHKLYARWESRIGDLLYGKDGLIYDDVMITV